MKKILYINGNPKKQELSYSRRTGNYYLEKIKIAKSDAKIDIFNVYEEDVPFIDEGVLETWRSLGEGTKFGDLTSVQQTKLNRMGEILTQFKEADEYVFISPLWNFSISPRLKAYIDNVMIAKETFKYTENGSVGLLKDKKAVIIQASGGVYSKGPIVGWEHGSNYIKVVLGFMGVTDIQTILVEGVAIPDKTEEEKLQKGYRQVDALFA